jgi:hypothetical protein
MTRLRCMSQRRAVISYFSVHDLKGTKPEIVHIDATGHDQQENDFGAK